MGVVVTAATGFGLGLLFSLLDKTPKQLDTIMKGIEILIKYKESTMGLRKEIKVPIYWNLIEQILINSTFASPEDLEAKLEEMKKQWDEDHWIEEKKRISNKESVFNYLGNLGADFNAALSREKLPGKTENDLESLKKQLDSVEDLVKNLIENTREAEYKHNTFSNTISDNTQENLIGITEGDTDEYGVSKETIREMVEIENLKIKIELLEKAGAAANVLNEEAERLRENIRLFDELTEKLKLLNEELKNTNGQASRDGFSGPGEGIMGSFKTGKSGLNNELHGIAQAFQTTLQNNINTVVENITGVNWEMMGMGFGRALGEGLKAFFDDLDWNEILMEDDEDIHIPIGNRLNYHEIKDIVETVMKKGF